jgi:integrase
MRGAIEALNRFEGDPEGFRPEGEERPEAIYLDEEIAREFLAWSIAVKRNTREWVGKQKRALAFWATKLHRVDLRRATLRDHVLPALQGEASRDQKIRVLKAFFSWLRKEKHLLCAAEDPTYGTLSAAQARPAQWRRSKAIPKEHVELVLEHLGAPWRDALMLQAATGWHVTEAARFASAGTVERLPTGARRDGSAAVVVCPMTKGGEMLRTRVSREVADAARRLRDHGAFSAAWYYRAVRSACDAAEIARFSPGMMRHSVATWAVNKGADPAVVSAFLGHKSVSTTRRFYATLAVPAKVPTLL